ncbi:MAG: acyltransferase [Clostridia bacterium]|nr:acyltransferase [Clostridia bacterium]
MENDWKSLDNAGKIFPPTSTKRDTKVFRFACELFDMVDPIFLQEALNRTIEEFPIYRCTLRRGFFWYYLKPGTVRPVVHEENTPPCSAIYDANRYNLLFDVTYFNKRINLEVYHALTDGTGALHFLRTLVYNYIIRKYADDFKENIPYLDYDASFTQKAEDSFDKYYMKTTPKQPKQQRAYQIKGAKTPENRIKIIEGLVSVKETIDKAREYNTTVSVLLASVFLCAINKNAVLAHKERPIVLTVPVNLRNYFSSASARNFFCTINVGYDFNKNPNDIESVIKHIDESFKKQLTEENLASRMNGFSAVEKNAFARITPLFFKDFVLGIAGRLVDRESTASISNIGRISMPDGFEKYIRLFDVFISTSKLQICICSYKDNLMLSFSSAFKSTDIQKDFFRMLADMGIHSQICANKITKEGSY